MTTRNDFIAALDDAPHDQILRSVFADWLEENQENEADARLSLGLRWMAANDRYIRFALEGKWRWMLSPESKVWQSCRMPDEFKNLPLSDLKKIWEGHATRHEAEVAYADGLWQAGITNPPAVVPQQREMEGATA